MRARTGLTATLFVHPTLYEGSSLVTLEAMAHRRAVSQPTGGLPDKVLPGTNGWLGQGGDADAVYYAAPIDLLRFFRSRGTELVTTSAEVRFGVIGRFLPVEIQGSTVFAWRVTI